MIRFRNINHKTLALYDKTCNFAKIKYFSYRITVNKLVYKRVFNTHQRYYSSKNNKAIELWNTAQNL